MKTPNFLETKQDVIILKNDESINKSKFDFHDDSLVLEGESTVFIYVEDYQKNHLNLDVLKNSNIVLYMIFKSSNEAEYEIETNLENSASLNLYTILRNVEKTKVTISRKSNLSAKAKLSLNNALLNMGETVLNETINLNDSFAQVEIDQLNIGSFNDEFEINQDILHNAKSTISNISNSLISHSNSKLRYSVSGRIFKGNELSSCKQINKGIILNEIGEIEVEPKLFIDEYNVEAAHGAAIGQIDDEQLYYLLSRGLTEEEARRLIISGYTKPFLNNIVDEDISQLVERQIQKKISEVNVI